MARPAHAQSGLTLMEVLIALAIAALLIAPLAAAVLNALKAQSVASDANDVAQQAQFAMQRMEAAVRRTAPPLAAASADWLAPVAYCLRAGTFLIETTPADAKTGCTSSSAPVIADGVSAFSVQSFNAGPGAYPVIEIQLTVTGATGQSVSLTSHTRLGGGTL
ncbi:MAG TPA: prepilin-type N-terminal cleavage/methylation domain-containing protein [Burkholderiales bacterium]